MDISDVLTVKTLSREEMRHWTGETAQWFRALAAFVEDAGSTPSTQIMTHSYLSLGQFQGNQPPLLDYEGSRYSHGAHTYTHAHKRSTHKHKINKCKMF